ncbi:MAG: hypothetical protein NZ556_07055, partial [Fimbriimonadales bacterium]|nr:hypothetical protein [Fimbriimonadales bacterium]
GRLAQEWLGQSCPSIGTDRTVRATNSVAWASRPRVAWTVVSKHRHGQDCPCHEKCGLGRTPKSGLDRPGQAQVRTGLYVPRKAWLGRDAPEWLGQSCPSAGTDRTVRATKSVAWTVVSKHRHGQECPCCGCTGKMPVPHGGRRRDADATQQDFLSSL